MLRMYDIIKKKKDSLSLGRDEIEFVVEGFTNGHVGDGQMGAFLMAVCLRGLNPEETACLTMAMAKSGDMVDLSGIKGVKVDKHSTGGVGDKTTLVISPIVASLGVPVAKMSGRGLGHTGGTVDKLEAIPGLRTAFTKDEFTRIVNQTGLCVAGQSGNLAPADKKIYGLRDVTATVDNIGLIAASIMSKKLAAGSDCILLDVKTGSGAFMKTVDDSIALAEAMVNIGYGNNRRTAALVTDMNRPLGHMVGNSCEIREAVDTLEGKGPEDLTEVCLLLAAEMLFLAGKGSLAQCREKAEKALRSGEALKKLVEMVEAQGGDARYIKDLSQWKAAGYSAVVAASQEGFVSAMDGEGIGVASCMLGAGREDPGGSIDYAAGIRIGAKTGDYVEKGQVLAELYTNDESKLAGAEARYLSSVVISDKRPEDIPLVYARVTKDGVEKIL